MQLENVIKRLVKFLNTRTEALSITVTSGGVDNMEKYQYIIGQITALEATRQEPVSYTHLTLPTNREV